MAFLLEAKRYKVIIEERKCGVKDSLFVTLPVATKPSVKTVKLNDINCFIGEATLPTGGGSRYEWKPAAGVSNPPSDQPVVRVNSTTTFHVTVTTLYGCVVEDSITVNVAKGDDGNALLVPNAFTPNGDENYDCFGVKYWGDVSDFLLSIFNHWGIWYFLPAILHNVGTVHLKDSHRQMTHSYIG